MMIQNSPVPDPARLQLTSCGLPPPTPHPLPQIPSLDEMKLLLIAQHYRARCNRVAEDQEQREPSPIVHLKKLHNWITSVLIQLHTRRGDSVLDLACGKGGDLVKWAKAEVGRYVGVDIVEGSLEHARRRYNESTVVLASCTPGKAARKACSFPARLICVDCFGPALLEALKGVEGPFDVCSCQFALHYSWSSEGRAREALRNVAMVLKEGGYFIGTMPDAEAIERKLRDQAGAMEFGNRVYRVKFERGDYARAMAMRTTTTMKAFGVQYEFHLEDAVDHCPEWLVPFPQLADVAQEYGLELVSRHNFHQFVHEHHLHLAADVADLLRRAAASSTISPDEWDCASIYLTFVFRKRPRTPHF